MFQVITQRDDKIGYHIHMTDIPSELSEDFIVFMPELSTKHLPHIKYVSKYTHKTGDIIIKLVRSDGFDPFGRPKSHSHGLVIPSEEYNLNTLLYYTSPLLYTNLFEEKYDEPQFLDPNSFQKSTNKILESLDLNDIREVIVAAMTDPKVTLQPNLEQKHLIELASLVDKSIPYEASYDFSLITYSDSSCRQHLVHNVLYFFDKNDKISNKIKIKNKKSKIEKIAREEKDYLDEYVELILNENYEKILEEHAKWVIGMYYNDHKELQKEFTKRYQLDMPFSRRNKFHARLVKSLSHYE
ncbi:MAG: hypothetical protein KGD64_09905 [Candidatus Heimdallarchaeota archaeon]|nr:hypothetical protein [Candidatus Heimdallarchaeota archaeon]